MDVDDVRLPSSPRTPQALYVSVRTEKFGQFLSLSDHARSRALQQQKKQSDADSARSQRRRSIFDAVKTVLLESNDGECPVVDWSTDVESSTELQEKMDVKEDMTPRVRYQRRGSCTKFSLEAELLSWDEVASDDDQAQHTFRSFRRNETLQNDEMYGESNGESKKNSDYPHASQCSLSKSSHKNYQLMTIDQLPLPMKRTVLPVGKSPSPLPARSFFPPSPSSRDDNPPLAGWSPLSCKTDPGSIPSAQKSNDKSNYRPRMPKLRHVSTSSQNKQKQSSGDSESRQKDRRYAHSERSAVHTKRRITQNLPTAPFADDMGLESSPGDQISNDHRRTDVERQRKSRESTPKFGSLLKRLNLQRNDSVKSFAEESANEDFSLMVVSTQREALRVERRASISTKTSTSPKMQKQSTLTGCAVIGSRYGDDDGSYHSRISRRSPSPASRSVASESRSSPHVRNSRHYFKRPESLDDSGADPLQPKKKFPPTARVVPPPPLPSTPTSLSRSSKIPRHPRRQGMSGQVSTMDSTPSRRRLSHA
jgi:hypothetical protein